MVIKRGILFFLLFIRHHWIAGVVRYDNERGFTLTIHDSAPSYYVYRNWRNDLHRCGQSSPS